MTSTAQEILSYQLIEISGTSITVGTALTALVVIFVTYVLQRFVRGVIRKAFLLRQITDEGIIALVSNLAGYLVLILGIGSALSTVGIDLGAVFAAGAVFAVGIGFALQSLAQNFVSGLLLMLERSIKVGDILEVESEVLRVVHMGIRSTAATGRDGEMVLIPNSTIVQNIVRNRSRPESYFRVKTTVGVAYESDLGKVTQALQKAADSLDEGFGVAQVLLLGFGSSSVDFEVAVWTDELWGERMFRSRLNHAIWDALKDAELVIAFPQLDVHFDRQPALAVAS